MPKLNLQKELAIDRLLSRNVEDVVDRAHLGAMLRSGKKLRVKLGIDPTGTKVHIGRAVILWKLREFQDLGHKIVLIVGDFTAQIGDPSDKLAKRPMLSAKDVKKNLKTYLAQIGKVLDLKKTEIRYNSAWLGKLNFHEISELADIFSVQQMIERRNFRDRWDRHEEIGLREFMYPLMQGYDSVVVKADVELGGTDQLFNLTAGRRIQERYKQKPQDIMTTKMLSGTDGRKMSTSWGNVINIIDAPDEQYGKVMAMHDEQIIEYFTLATDAIEAELTTIEDDLKRGANPKLLKQKLALAIVSRYHGKAKAMRAAEKWEKLFSKKDFSGELPELVYEKGATTSDIVMKYGELKNNSKGEIFRFIKGGAVMWDGRKVLDPLATFDTARGGEVVKIGKKHFFRVKK